MSPNGHLTSLPDREAPAMWDGVIAPSGYATRPAIGLTAGAKISDAYTALLFVNKPPSDPIYGITTNGARPELTITDAYLLNNQHDVVLAPLSLAAPIPLLGATIRDSRFLTTRALNNPVLKPKHHIYLAGVRNLPIAGCTFANTSGLDSGSPTLWGRGITASSSTPWILASEQRRSTFMNLHMGTTIATTITSGAAMVDEADFIGCAAGAYIRASDHATITRNTFQVPDVDVSFTGVAAAYGAYMHGSSGFIFEENSFTGPGNGAEEPTVGAVFNAIGPESNVYYNNTFNAFTNAGGQSAGTIIMGNNDGPNPGDGLVIKCNDYSLISPNDFDVAFTGPNVKIGDAQGGNEDQTDPAGNTFAPNCSGSQHFHNNEEDMAEFKYFHHDPLSTSLQVVPECASDPIEVSGMDSWYEETEHAFVKSTVCPFLQGLLFSMGGQMAIAASAEASQSMSESLEEGGQQYQLKAQAMHRLTALALRDSVAEGLDSALHAHKTYPLYTSAQSVLGLYITKGELDSARLVVDAALEEDPEAVYWLVQHLYLSEVEQDADPYAATHLMDTLETLANTGEHGHAHALAWLGGMGQHVPEVIILPAITKRLHAPEEMESVLPRMLVFPNPSDGTINVTVHVPEGTEQASLKVLDLVGRVMIERRISAGTLTEELYLPLSTGFYMAALYLNGVPAVSTKFRILR
ncbi:MAG: hypothetical protein KIT10_12680 [Flavobacteriales bacterium]|nr:hypothetical protein [Flavobacteriales bacterium]